MDGSNRPRPMMAGGDRPRPTMDVCRGGDGIQWVLDEEENGPNGGFGNHKLVGKRLGVDATKLT